MRKAVHEMFWVHVSVYAARLGMDAKVVGCCVRLLACTVCFTALVVFGEPWRVVEGEALFSDRLLWAVYWIGWAVLSVYGSYWWVRLVSSYIRMYIDLKEK